MNKLYYFSTKTCTKCRMMSNLLGKLNIPVEIEKIDCDDSPDMATKYGIQAVPTFVLIREDQEIWRTSTLVPLSVLESQIRGAYNDTSTT